MPPDHPWWHFHFKEQIIPATIIEGPEELRLRLRALKKTQRGLEYSHNNEITKLQDVIATQARHIAQLKKLSIDLGLCVMNFDDAKGAQCQTK